MGKLKKLFHFAGCLLFSSPLWAPINPARLNIKTQDGSVNTYPYQARFTNGTVTDNSDGTVSIAISGSSGASLTSTNTWTAGQTFNSSTTFNGAVVISTSVSLNGTVGANGNYFTSGGPGSVATWTDPTTTFLTLSSATATYLQNSSATATYLQSSSATATYLQQSSATATYLQISSATTNYPKLGVGNLFTQSNTYSSSSTFSGAVIISTSINANGQGTNGQFLTSGGPGAVVSWTSGGVGDVVKASTQVFTGGNTFISSTTFSGTVVNSGSTTIKGTTTNDNAAVGIIGEFIDGTVSLAIIPSASGVPTSVSTITLTAGDWDVAAMGFFNPNGATITNSEITINTTANTDGTLGDNAIRVAETATSVNETALAIPRVRISISVTTPVYLVIDVTYTIGTPRFAGNIRARRLR